ncbi:hypothetical protein P8631_03380 [Guyparkeria sp. 1SP6A2]|nr:hypothetical protein [Guyparkeria sp. 1SP6A2]
MRNLSSRTPRCLALIGLTALASVWLSPASATKVYQYQNSAGETVFTDQPVEGATVHEVESAPVIPFEPVAPPEVLTADDLHQSAPAEADGQSGQSGQQAPESAESPPAVSGKTGSAYEHFQIVEPVDGEVASRVSGSITIELAIQPALQSGDRLRVLIDGQPYVKDSTGRRHLVNGLPPGEHVITAQIRRDGEVVREAPAVRFRLITAAQ